MTRKTTTPARNSPATRTRCPLCSKRTPMTLHLHDNPCGPDATSMPLAATMAIGRLKELEAPAMFEKNGRRAKSQTTHGPGFKLPNPSGWTPATASPKLGASPEETDEEPAGPRDALPGHRDLQPDQPGRVGPDDRRRLPVPAALFHPHGECARGRPLPGHPHLPDP